ncbi:UNKNOWN [Stylonychia lemnae]|uniref:TRAF-type domain-containing protein n=1 Tax=Stylonychia lemnae TaxID=5949 RepID=A0A078AE29_STYLE|nr:UNKNOWN [Stylonychia lemnae]|eukprot:CDW80455.1 UNKNOWN [Stylonychia lemnae]
MESTANPSSTPSADTKICSNCNKPIEISKFRMHEIGCARNNIKCPQCREIVLKSDLPAHEAEYHTVVSIMIKFDGIIIIFQIQVITFFQMNCEYCNDFECEKMLMKDHQQYCDMKPRQCQYCELKFPGGNQYDNHLSFCGSKTTKCEDCGQLVRNKDQRSHKISDTCKLIREMEDEKISKELKKFQEEEEKRMNGGSRKLNKLENQSIGENQKQSKGSKQNEAVTKIVSSMTKIQDKGKNFIKLKIPIETIERGYVKSKHATKEKQQMMNQFKQKPNQPANKQKQTPLKNSQSIFDEEIEQEMLARKLQEEFDREEAMRLQEEFGGLDPGISQDGFIDEDGAYVRPPEDIYEDQLIQGDDDYNPRQMNKRVQKMDYKQQKLDSHQSKKSQPPQNSRDTSNNNASNSRNTRQNQNQTSNQSNSSNRNQSSNSSFNTRQTANTNSSNRSSNQPTLLQKRYQDNKQNKNNSRKPKYQEDDDDVDSELYQYSEGEDEYEYNPNYSQESQGGRKNKDIKQQNQSANSRRSNRKNVINDNDDEDDAEEAMIKSGINKSKHHKR